MKNEVSILILLGAVATTGAHDPSQEYRFSVKLAGEDYILHWTADFQNNNLEAAVNVSTTGWVGFGLSPNGQMPGSDVIIAWVNNEGEVQFQDRHAVGRFLPLIDSSQDWILVSGEEQDGRTTIKFARPLLSCDSEDDLDITVSDPSDIGRCRKEIRVAKLMDHLLSTSLSTQEYISHIVCFAAKGDRVDTSRVVWSYHSQDPANEEELATLQHERMGASSLNFLGGLNEERVEEDTQSFSLLSNNVIPENDTTYWCTVHALPDEVAAQERYIYKFSPVIAESTAPSVHHIVAYLCSNLDNSSVGDSELCDGAPNDIQLCRSSGMFAAWAVGGMDFVFPNGVSYPMGGKGEEFLVLEMHYNNPRMIEGMVDNSGMEFFYTNEAPENRAGLLTIGQESLSTLIIPPGADNFVVNALAPQQCTEKFLPKEGITIFSSLLHTHVAGRGLVVRHLRNTEECGGLEELEPINQNLRYDFNYQQINILPRSVKLLQGDILHLQCLYRTSAPSYRMVTLGGESTHEEMCVAFMYYYPESELIHAFGNQVAGEQFEEQYLQPGVHDALQASYLNDDHQSVNRIFNQVEWNQQSVESFQSAVQSSAISTLCVNVSNLTASILSEDVLPQADCPYEPPSKDCPISGAEKLLSISVQYIFILCIAYLVL